MVWELLLPLLLQVLLLLLDSILLQPVIWLLLILKDQPRTSTQLSTLPSYWVMPLRLWLLQLLFKLELLLLLLQVTLTLLNGQWASPLPTLTTWSKLLIRLFSVWPVLPPETELKPLLMELPLVHGKDMPWTTIPGLLVLPVLTSNSVLHLKMLLLLNLCWLTLPQPVLSMP